MNGYVIVYSKSAVKDLRKLPADVSQRILEAINDLADNPRPHGSKNFREMTTFIEFVSATTVFFMRFMTSR